MRNAWILAYLLPLLAEAQEKPTGQPVVTQVVSESVPVQKTAFDGSFAPIEVEIVGYVDYGQTSAPVTYTSSPRYRALLFSGYGGDIVDIIVDGADRRAFVAVTDSTLKQLVRGTQQVHITLPDHGPDLEVWYVLFRDLEDKSGRFTVHVKKVGRQPRQRGARTPTSGVGSTR